MHHNQHHSVLRRSGAGGGRASGGGAGESVDQYLVGSPSGLQVTDVVQIKYLQSASSTSSRWYKATVTWSGTGAGSGCTVRWSDGASDALGEPPGSLHRLNGDAPEWKANAVRAFPRNTPFLDELQDVMSNLWYPPTPGELEWRRAAAAELRRQALEKQRRIDNSAAEKIQALVRGHLQRTSLDCRLFLASLQLSQAKRNVDQALVILQIGSSSARFPRSLLLSRRRFGSWRSSSNEHDRTAVVPTYSKQESERLFAAASGLSSSLGGLWHAFLRQERLAESDLHDDDKTQERIPVDRHQDEQREVAALRPLLNGLVAACGSSGGEKAQRMAFFCSDMIKYVSFPLAPPPRSQTWLGEKLRQSPASQVRLINSAAPLSVPRSYTASVEREIKHRVAVASSYGGAEFEQEIRLAGTTSDNFGTGNNGRYVNSGTRVQCAASLKGISDNLQSVLDKDSHCTTPKPMSETNLSFDLSKWGQGEREDDLREVLVYEHLFALCVVPFEVLSEHAELTVSPFDRRRKGSNPYGDLMPKVHTGGVSSDGCPFVTIGATADSGGQPAAPLWERDGDGTSYRLLEQVPGEFGSASFQLQALSEIIAHSELVGYWPLVAGDGAPIALIENAERDSYRAMLEQMGTGDESDASNPMSPVPETDGAWLDFLTPSEGQIKEAAEGDQNSSSWSEHRKNRATSSAILDLTTTAIRDVGISDADDYFERRDALVENRGLNTWEYSRGTIAAKPLNKQFSTPDTELGSEMEPSIGLKVHEALTACGLDVELKEPGVLLSRRWVYASSSPDRIAVVQQPGQSGNVEIKLAAALERQHKLDSSLPPPPAPLFGLHKQIKNYPYKWEVYDDAAKAFVPAPEKWFEDNEGPAKLQHKLQMLHQALLLGEHKYDVDFMYYAIYQSQTGLGLYRIQYWKEWVESVLVRAIDHAYFKELPPVARDWYKIKQRAAEASSFFVRSCGGSSGGGGGGGDDDDDQEHVGLYAEALAAVTAEAAARGEEVEVDTPPPKAVPEVPDLTAADDAMLRKPKVKKLGQFHIRQAKAGGTMLVGDRTLRLLINKTSIDSWAKSSSNRLNFLLNNGNLAEAEKLLYAKVAPGIGLFLLRKHHEYEQPAVKTQRDLTLRVMEWAGEVFERYTVLQPINHLYRLCVEGWAYEAALHAGGIVTLEFLLEGMTMASLAAANRSIYVKLMVGDRIQTMTAPAEVVALLARVGCVDLGSETVPLDLLLEKLHNDLSRLAGASRITLDAWLKRVLVLTATGCEPGGELSLFGSGVPGGGSFGDQNVATAEAVQIADYLAERFPSLDGGDWIDSGGKSHAPGEMFHLDGLPMTEVEADMRRAGSAALMTFVSRRVFGKPGALPLTGLLGPSDIGDANMDMNEIFPSSDPRITPVAQTSAQTKAALEKSKLKAEAKSVAELKIAFKKEKATMRGLVVFYQSKKVTSNIVLDTAPAPSANVDQLASLLSMWRKHQTDAEQAAWDQEFYGQEAASAAPSSWEAQFARIQSSLERESRARLRMLPKLSKYQPGKRMSSSSPLPAVAPREPLKKTESFVAFIKGRGQQEHGASTGDAARAARSLASSLRMGDAAAPGQSSKEGQMRGLKKRIDDSTAEFLLWRQREAGAAEASVGSGQSSHFKGKVEPPMSMNCAWSISTYGKAFAPAAPERSKRRRKRIDGDYSTYELSELIDECKQKMIRYDDPVTSKIRGRPTLLGYLNGTAKSIPRAFDEGDKTTWHHTEVAKYLRENGKAVPKNRKLALEHATDLSKAAGPPGGGSGGDGVGSGNKDEYERLKGKALDAKLTELELKKAGSATEKRQRIRDYYEAVAADGSGGDAGSGNKDEYERLKGTALDAKLTELELKKTGSVAEKRQRIRDYYGAVAADGGGGDAGSGNKDEYERLKGKALDAKLTELELKKTGGVAEKRQRIRDHYKSMHNWLQCGDCGKWRKVSLGVFAQVDAETHWECSMNLADPHRSSCAADEEKDDSDEEAAGGAGGAAQAPPATDINEKDDWLLCDACGKWRKVSAATAADVNDEDFWECSMNLSDPPHSNCDAPEEIEVEGDDEEGEDMEGDIEAKEEVEVEEEIVMKPRVAEAAGAGREAGGRRIASS